MSNNDRTTLDPQVATLLQMQAAANPPPMETLPPEAVREGFKAQSAMLAATPEPMERIENIAIPGDDGELHLRLYYPTRTAGSDSDLLPLTVYYHGGGWVICDLDTHDDLCRSLAAESGSLVISVDYRLAPEHPYPAAVDDAWAALLWIAENAASIGGDYERIAVAGDSAGGNLAAVTALMARNQGGPEIALQLLFYPVTDIYDLNRPSHQQFADGYGLTRAAMEWFRELYLPAGQDPKDPHVSPLYATDLAGLPPAVVITAEADVLRDEGVAYAKALQDAGNHVEFKQFPGMVHGFVSMAGVVTAGMTARKEAGASLRKFLT